MMAKVMAIDTGIEIITMNVERGSCRKRKSNSAVRIIPMKILTCASSTDD